MTGGEHASAATPLRTVASAVWHCCCVDPTPFLVRTAHSCGVAAARRRRSPARRRSRCRRAGGPHCELPVTPRLCCGSARGQKGCVEVEAGGEWLHVHRAGTSRAGVSLRPCMGCLPNLHTTLTKGWGVCGWGVLACSGGDAGWRWRGRRAPKSVCGITTPLVDRVPMHSAMREGSRCLLGKCSGQGLMGEGRRMVATWKRAWKAHACDMAIASGNRGGKGRDGWGARGLRRCWRKHALAGTERRRQRKRRMRRPANTHRRRRSRCGCMPRPLAALRRT